MKCFMRFKDTWQNSIVWPECLFLDRLYWNIAIFQPFLIYLLLIFKVPIPTASKNHRILKLDRVFRSLIYCRKPLKVEESVLITLLTDKGGCPHYTVWSDKGKCWTAFPYDSSVAPWLGSTDILFQALFRWDNWVPERSIDSKSRVLT